MPKNAWETARALVADGRFACVVVKHDEVVSCETGRGIAPILKLYDIGALSGASVVDKVVGRAAAMVMTAGGVTTCHAGTISRGALAWFRERGVSVSYDTLTDHIINRTGDGMCPMESAVSGIEDEETALAAIRKRLAELAGK